MPAIIFIWSSIFFSEKGLISDESSQQKQRRCAHIIYAKNLKTPAKRFRTPETTCGKISARENKMLRSLKIFKKENHKFFDVFANLTFKIKIFFVESCIHRRLLGRLSSLFYCKQVRIVLLFSGN